MDLCKFCYRLQWCLHGSVQILGRSRHLNGFFTSLLLLVIANALNQSCCSPCSTRQIKHGGRKNFMWSDEEINSLLHVVIDYKAGKAGEEVDWETVRSKYEDVTKMFLEKYPDDDKEKFRRRTEASRSFNKDRI